jgi:starch synthase
MTESLKAIVVNTSSSGSRLGGAAIAAEWHSRLLAERIPIELWRMWDRDSLEQVGSLSIRNFNSYIPLKWIGSRLPRHAQALLLRSRIPEELLRVRPPIIHLQNPGPPFEFLRIAKKCKEQGMRVVASTHGFYETFTPNYALNHFQRFLWPFLISRPIERACRYVDAFVSGYPDEKELLLGLGVPLEKIHLVPNGVNPFFQLSPNESEIGIVLNKFQLDADRPILLYMGNHTSNKGIDAVIRMASRLDVPTTLIIGGKLRNQKAPEQWRSMISKTSPLKLVVSDYLSIEEQRVIYGISTALIFPSMADTLPLTILEAMACGLPVIAYRTGGIPFQLENDCGIVVPQGDEEALFEETRGLLLSNEKRRRIRENAKSRQRSIFTWELAAAKTIKIYEDLIQASTFVETKS